MCTRRQSRTSTNIFVSSHKPTAATSKNTQKKQKTKETNPTTATRTSLKSEIDENG